VPWDLIAAGHSRELILLSLAGAVWGLAKRERGVILTLLWVAAVLLCANPSLLGLPCTWLVNNASAAIALFLPLAILGGYFLASLCEEIRARLRGKWRSLHRWALGLSIVAVAIWGALGMLSIVNPACILATRDDMAAMEWIRQNTPKDAKFLINARYWQWGLYVGTDGGYWIRLLAGRKTTLPPVVYGFISPEYIAEVNALARPMASPALAKRALLDDEGMRRLLDERGVTHVYIGARGGSIRPTMLLDNPYWRLVYSSGAVWIFERGTDERMPASGRLVPAAEQPRLGGMNFGRLPEWTLADHPKLKLRAEGTKPALRQALRPQRGNPNKSNNLRAERTERCGPKSSPRRGLGSL